MYQSIYVILILKSGAVTSCGTQGDKGAQGETGKQGPQGEQGPKGDTVFPVVILSEGVKCDVIEGKAGDKYTLTFTAPEGKEIVSKLTINYENVDITDEIVNGTYTGTFESSVIVSAEFGSVKEYGESILENFYKKLTDADKDLATVAEDGETNSQTGCSSFADESLASLYKSAKTSIQIAAATADKSVKEKVELVKAEISKQEKAIKEAYEKLISNAKQNAINGLESLYKLGHNSESDELEAGGRKDMTDADRAAMLSKGKSQVEACTTLNAIGKLVAQNLTNTNYLNDNSSSYAELEKNRSTVFAAIEAALQNIYGTDEEFDPENESNKTLMSMLEDTYGVKESELPEAVAETYRQKASSATSFSTVSKTDSTIALAKEAYDAVTNAYDSIMKKVQDAVVAVYDKDISAYANLNLNGDQNWIATTHSAVVNLVQNWIKTTRNSSDIGEFTDEKLGTVYFEKLSVSNLVSYNGDGSNVDPYGGVSYIEDYLALYNIPFKNYRLENEKNSIISNVTQYASNIVSKDAKYNSFLTKSGTNSIKDEMIAVDSAVADHYKSNSIHKYNISEFVNELQVSSDVDSVTEIRALLQEYKWAVDYIYGYAKIEYMNNYDTLNGTSGNYGKYSTIVSEVTKAKGYSVDSNSTLGDDVKLFTDEYQSKMADVEADVTDSDVRKIVANNFGEIDDYVTNFKNHLTLIKSLDTGYNDFIGTINDMDFSDLVYQSDVINEKAAIFKNSVSASDIQNFVSNLKTSYSNKIVQYLKNSKDTLAEFFNYEYVLGNNANFDRKYRDEIDKIYNSLVEQAGTTFACNSYHSINSWLKFAKKKLAGFADNKLTAVPKELAGKSADGTVVSSVTGDSISQSLTISTTKNLLVSDASAYDAVYDIKVSSLNGYASGDVYNLYGEADRVNNEIYAVYFNLGEALSGESAYLSIDGVIKYINSLGNLSKANGKLAVLFKEAGKKSVSIEWSKGSSSDPVHRVKVNIEVGALADNFE